VNYSPEGTLGQVNGESLRSGGLPLQPLVESVTLVIKHLKTNMTLYRVECPALFALLLYVAVELIIR
jgi:hypothetical protein